MSRPAVALVLIALAVGAGCSSLAGSGGGGAPTATVTPAPVPTVTPSPAPTPVAPSATATPRPAGAGPLPPGVARDGVRSASDLARAHAAALVGRSYTWTVRTERRVLTDAGTRLVTTRRRVRVENRTTYLARTVRVTRWPNGSATREVRTTYADGDSRHARFLEGGRARYRTWPLAGTTARADQFRTASMGYVLKYLTVPSATVDRHDGGYRLATTDQPYGLGQPYGALDVDDYRATARVTSAGFVRRLEVGYRVPVRDRVELVTIRLRYSDLGNTTVSPPDWYDTARASG